MPKMFKPTKKLPGKEFYKEEYEKLGKMSHDEKIGGLVTVALIVFMLTGDIIIVRNSCLLLVKYTNRQSVSKVRCDPRYWQSDIHLFKNVSSKISDSYV